MRSRKLTDTVQLKLRIREDLRRKLEREAKKKEVSLNAEMVDRLIRSFDGPERVNDALGGEHTAALLRGFAAAIARVEARIGRRWNEDDEARERAYDAVHTVLRDLSAETHDARAREMKSAPPESYWEDSDAMGRLSQVFLSLHAAGAQIPRRVWQILDEDRQEQR
jgi:hypothetical protein